MDLSILKFADSANKSEAFEKAKLAREKKEDAQLKQSCRDFESVMTSILLKEGLRAAQASSFAEGEDTRDNASKQYTEIANEQIGTFIGKTGLLGIGDYLYKSVKHQMHVKQEAMKK